MSESLEAFKKTLEECQKGIELWNAQKMANDAVVQYNAEQNDIYTYITLPAYQARLDEYHANVNNYQSCIINNKNALRNDRRFWKNCSEWWDADPGKQHHDWCRNETGMDLHVNRDGAGCRWGQGKGVCAYSETQVETIANERCGTGYYARPEKPLPPPFKEQNLTPFSLNCCANYVQVIGSNVEDSTINQQNQCMANLQEKIEEASKSTITTSSPQTQVPTTVAKPSTSQQKQDQGSMNIYIIIFIIVSCLLCTSASGLIVYNMQQS